MNNTTKFMLVAVISLLVGITGTFLLVGGPINDDGNANPAGADGKEPLYWVAPMDPNYRRDEPGKSPMGMDLVPVYEEGPQEPGTVQISPDVVNNLGVRTATVEAAPLNPEVKTVGYVQYDEDRLVNIDPRVEGWIQKLHVEAEGDAVTSGDPLYTLYSPTLVNAQQELLLALNQGNSGLVTAATERLKALRVPEATIQKVRDARQVLQNITINAPQSGVVDRLEAREGAYVTPGSRIMSIAMLDYVWVVGEIFERQLPLVERGNPVVMTLDYLPSRRWQGEVDYIYPSVDTTTRTARIRTRFANPDRALKPGMFTQLVISGGKSTETLVIPREALIRTGESSRVVLAQGDGKFKSINVSVGRVVDRQVEILSGLEEGDRIVTSAQFLIDSESSKTSDFTRMDHGADEEGQPESVWVPAEVEDLMADHRMVTLYHEPIDEWQWPAMTMDFTVAESVDIDKLSPGTKLHAEITRQGNGSFQVSAIHIPDDGELPPQATDQTPPTNGAAMDHSQHQNMGNSASGGMDHSQHQDMNSGAGGGQSRD